MQPQSVLRRPVGCLLWAVHVGQIEIVWQDRGDAAKGRSEPILLKFCDAANGSLEGSRLILRQDDYPRRTSDPILDVF